MIWKKAIWWKLSWLVGQFGQNNSLVKKTKVSPFCFYKKLVILVYLGATVFLHLLATKRCNFLVATKVILLVSHFSTKSF